MTRMIAFGAELLEQRRDAAQAHVFDRLERRNLLGMECDVVRDQPFAHAVVRERDAVRIGFLEHVNQHQRTGHDDLGAFRVDVGQPLALGGAHATQLARQLLQRRQREHVAVQVLDRFAALHPVRDARERVNRSRAAVHALGQEIERFLQRLAHLLANRAAQFLELAARRWVGLEKQLGEAQAAERRRHREHELVPVAHHELRAAAADVDDQCRLLVESERRLHREIDEPAFLFPRDHARRHARELARSREELAAVLRFAHRGRRGAKNAVDLVAARELDVARERIHGAADRVRSEPPAGERVAPDLHDLALPVDHLERPERRRLGDHHVDRVRADVDGGDAHAGSPKVSKPSVVRSEVCRVSDDQGVKETQTFPPRHCPEVAHGLESLAMSTPSRSSLRFALAAACLSAIAFAGPAHADRTQVYSIQKADCGDCGAMVQAELKKAKGIKKSSFDKYKVELTVTMADGVSDDVVLAAAERAHLAATVGPGQGAYLPHPKYPDGADVVLLTNSGADVGPIEKLRVKGKYTVFDVYADWCGPCRTVDAHLRDMVAQRKDVAVRRLNVVNFESPLAKRIGAKLRALPYVIVIAPDGKRTELVGSDLPK